MIALALLLGVALVVALATMVFGWWAVPIVCLVGAVLAPRRSRPLLAVPLGAALGWAVLLLRDARAEGFARLWSLIGQLVPVSPFGLVAATLLIPLILGLGAALIADGWRPSERSQEVSRP